MAGEDFQVSGQNAAALFTLKLHRGDGMTLVAMNWKDGEPPRDFVGFAIEYKEPDGDEFFAVKNRINFPAPGARSTPSVCRPRSHRSRSSVGCTSRATPIFPGTSSTRFRRSS